MKPKKSFFATIAEVLHKLDHQRLLVLAHPGYYF